jgi:hypothetical protein
VSKGQITRRVLGTLLLLATIGLTTCQGAFYASLPSRTDSTETIEPGHG